MLELVGKKWTVEYHHNNRDIVIDGDIKQSVYVYKYVDYPVSKEPVIQFNSMLIHPGFVMSIVFRIHD